MWEHTFNVKGEPITIMEARLLEGMDLPLKQCTEGSIVQLWPNPEFGKEGASSKTPKYVLRVIPDGIKPGQEAQASKAPETPQ